MNNQTNIIKIFIADRHILFRNGVKDSLQGPPFEVSGEAQDLNEVMTKLPNMEIDVLITDYRLFEDDAVDFVPEIKKKFPKLKILMLTLFSSKEGLLRYIDLVEGYISKSANSDQLREAIKTLMKGRNYYFID